MAVVVAATVLPVGVSVGSAPAVVSEPGVCQTGSIGRFTDCKSGYYTWNIRQSNGGEILGTAEMWFTISEVVQSRSREWSAHYSVFVVNLTGVAVNGTGMAVVPECAGTCSAGAGLPDTGTVLEINQSINGDVEFGSPGSGEDVSRQTVNLYLFNAAAQTPGTTYGDPQTTLGPVRCDDGAPSDNPADPPPVPGCVLADQVPTFVITSAEWRGDPVPAHAAFVAAAQNNPRTMGLGRRGGPPLVREFLPDQRAKDAKRRRVCGSFKRNPSPPGMTRLEADSCDEYPYHSSYQGVPAFAVTGHVPLLQNTNAGNRLNQFFVQYHVNDGDPFYVQP